MRCGIVALLCLLGLPGCVRRTISISTEPPGALVWLNDREVGRTPVEVDFLYYGQYDVRIEKDGCEPLMTSGTAEAPFWDWAGIDLISELMPFELHSRVAWDYTLEPAVVDEAALVDRARQLRDSMPPPPPDGVPTQGLTSQSAPATGGTGAGDRP